MIYSVSTELYEEVRRRLTEQIADRNYFSGSVAFPFEGMECRLVTSCFVRRGRLDLPEGTTFPVTDLVPVWWEFHTADAEAERINDFSFSSLRACF